MKRPYNDAPIGRLLVDVLQINFWVVAGGDEHPAERQDKMWAWISLGHVCAHWRAVLLNMPTLWASDVLAFKSQDVFDTILPRAQNAPLHLIVRTDPRWCSFAQITQLIPRAETLSCAISSPEEGFTVLDSLTSIPLPLLQTLLIENFAGISGLQLTGHVRFKTLDHLPALSDLCMIHVYIRPPLFGQLRDLQIIGPLKSRLRPTLHDILHVLTHNKGIRTFVLDDVLDEVSTTTTRPVLVMPCLDALHVRVRAADTLDNFLDAVSMPVLKNIEADTKDLSRRGVDVFRVLSKALSAYHLVSDAPSSPKLTFMFNLKAKSLKIHVYNNYANSCLNQRVSFEIRFPRTNGTSDVISSTTKAIADARFTDRVQELVWNPFWVGCDTKECWDTVLATFKHAEEFIFPSCPRVNDIATLLGLPDFDRNLRLPHLRQIMLYIHPELDQIFQNFHELKVALHLCEERGLPTCSVRLIVEAKDVKKGLRVLLHETAAKHGVRLTDYNSYKGRWNYHLEITE